MFLQLDCPSAVPCNPGYIGSIAPYGKGFAMVDPQRCGILQLDDCLCPVESFETPRKYRALCYDPTHTCYWAVADSTASLLVQLDDCFREIGGLRVSNLAPQYVSGLSYDPCLQGFWLSYPNSIAFLNQQSCELSFYPSQGQSRLNTGILAICGCQMISYLEHNRQFIEFLCPNCGCQTELCIPRDKILKAMCPIYHGHHEDCHRAGDKVLLILGSLCSNEFFFQTLHFHCTCHDNAEDCGCDCQQWDDHHGCTPPPCPPHCQEKPPCCPCDPCDPCNNCDPCHDCHGSHGCDCCHGCHPCDPCVPCNHCAPYEIMHSIALQEAGIAHILNAEGEKLQKAVASDCSIQELLCINESVKRTITQITQLEGQLYSKLETVTSCMPCTSCEEDCCMPPPCPGPIPEPCENEP